MDDKVLTLARATRRALTAMEDGADASDVLPDLTALYAAHGLDENTAESSLDWLEGGAGLLVESLGDALARVSA